MRILETHAKNEKEAIELATTYLSIGPEAIELELHAKGSSGFLGLGEREPSIYHINAVEGKTPLQVVIKGVIATILHKMGYKAKVVKFEKLEESEKLYVELASPHAGYIIGKKGRTLESLQFIVNLLVEQFTKTPPRILLDIENYRARRAQHLEDMAKKTASYVIRSGRSKLLDPLNPYERRLVHMALQEDDRVGTESEGNGVYKRVRIFKAGSESQPAPRDEQPKVRGDEQPSFDDDVDEQAQPPADETDGEAIPDSVDSGYVEDPEKPTIKPVESRAQDD